MKYVIVLWIAFLVSEKIGAQSTQNYILFKDVYDNLEMYYKYIQYGLEVEEAHSDGSPVPPPSFLEGVENKKLSKLIEKLDADLETFNNKKPLAFQNITVEQYASGTLLTRSHNHSILLSNLEKLNKKQKEWNGYERTVSISISLTTKIRKSSLVLSKFFRDAYRTTGNGFTELSNMFGFEAYKLSEETSKQLANIHNRLKKANKKIDKQVTEFNRGKKLTIENISVLLSVQEKSLRDSIQALEGKLKLSDAKVKLWVAKFDLNEKDIQFQQENLLKLKQVRANLVEMKADISSNESEIKRCEEEISRKEAEKRNLSFCPNGYGWEDCTHDDEKSLYTRNSNKLRSDIDDLQQNKAILNNENRELATQYKDEADAYNVEARKAKSELARLNKRKEELMDSNSNIEGEVLKYLQLKNEYKKLLEENENHFEILSR